MSKKVKAEVLFPYIDREKGKQEVGKIVTVDKDFMDGMNNGVRKFFRMISDVATIPPAGTDEELHEGSGPKGEEGPDGYMTGEGKIPDDENPDGDGKDDEMNNDDTKKIEEVKGPSNKKIIDNKKKKGQSIQDKLLSK